MQFPGLEDTHPIWGSEVSIQRWWDSSCRIEFQRTLRTPDDHRDYRLPPGLGSFPRRHLDDYAAPAGDVAEAGLRHCANASDRADMDQFRLGLSLREEGLRDYRRFLGGSSEPGPKTTRCCPRSPGSTVIASRRVSSASSSPCRQARATWLRNS